MSNAFSTLIIFLLLFSFKVPVIYNSIILSVILCTPFIFMPSVLSNVMALFKAKFFYVCSAYLIGIVIFTSFLTVLYGKYDFSFTLRFLFQIAYLVFSILVTAVVFQFGRSKNSESFVEKCILNAFLLQALIIIIAFISPAIREIVQLFQDEMTVQISAQYGGVRGLALAGAQFFGLAVGFSIALLLATFLYINNNISSFKYAMYFLLFTIAIFFVGRTGLLGVAFSVIYLAIGLVRSNKFKKIIKFALTFFLLIILGFFIFYLLVPTAIKDNVFNYLLPFAFEGFYNYFNKGTFSTNSTNTLERMYFAINGVTLLLGDGVYTNPDDTYYMHTDTGYMRVTLYGGVFCMILMLAYQLYIINTFSRFLSLLNYISVGAFYSLIIILVLIFQYKGEVIGFLAIMQIILFLLLSSMFLRLRKLSAQEIT